MGPSKGFKPDNDLNVNLFDRSSVEGRTEAQRGRDGFALSLNLNPGLLRLCPGLYPPTLGAGMGAGGSERSKEGGDRA